MLSHLLLFVLPGSGLRRQSSYPRVSCTPSHTHDSRRAGGDLLVLAMSFWPNVYVGHGLVYSLLSFMAYSLDIRPFSAPERYHVVNG